MDVHVKFETTPTGFVAVQPFEICLKALIVAEDARPCLHDSKVREEKLKYGFTFNL